MELLHFNNILKNELVTLGRIGQSVTCLATDASLTADPGVANSIPVRSHTFVEIDHEMQSNLSYPNVDYSKLLGYSKTMDSPDFFRYYLLQ